MNNDYLLRMVIIIIEDFNEKVKQQNPKKSKSLRSGDFSHRLAGFSKQVLFFFTGCVC